MESVLDPYLLYFLYLIYADGLVVTAQNDLLTDTGYVLVDLVYSLIYILKSKLKVGSYS